MKFLPKQIWKEEYTYYSDKSIDFLKSDILQLIDKSKAGDFSVNLTGEFISEYEFKITPKWQFVIIKNIERDASYLNGRIHSDADNRTMVTFTVRPNSIVLIFFFLFPIFGIFALFSNNIKNTQIELTVVSLVFIIVVPALSLLYGNFVKQEIKNRFIQTFYLKPIE